jgi:hypothetical protein
MHKSFISSAVVFCLFFLTVSAMAQTKEKAQADSLGIMKWLSKSFVLDKPDTGFILLEGGNGYYHKDLGATIKFITFPGGHSKAQAESLERKSTDSSLVLNIERYKWKGQDVFFIIREEISPDTTKSENFISLMAITGIDDVTIGIMGAYPKSKDKFLRKKFIQSGLTLREQ